MSDLIKNIMDNYQAFDRNADGDPAIKSLDYLTFESPTVVVSQQAQLVLVFVEPRLLTPLSGAGDLMQSLSQFKADLAADGLQSRCISASVYRGAREQDGRTILAIRSFLRDVKQAFPNFLGVVFVGNFPAATLVRRWIWKVNFDTTIGGLPTNGAFYLSIQPELIATRAEIVLADLSGSWDALYHENPTVIESICAIPDAATASTAWPVDGDVFSSTQYTRKNVSYSDFFMIDDAYYTVFPPQDGRKDQLRLFVITRQLRNPEIGASDLGWPNPIVRPDIMVSRINAKNIAENPDPAIRGDDGASPLDAAGYPKAFSSSKVYPTDENMLREDPVLERRLLCEYFDRNHRYRTGAFADLPFRVGAISASGFPAQSPASVLTTASRDFHTPLMKENATLVDYVRWLKEPAVLRHIWTHARRRGSTFSADYNVPTLEQEVGGRPFRWFRSGMNYTPSLIQQSDAACLFLHRTIWQNGILRDAGANLFIHCGCEVLTVEDEGVGGPQYYEEGYATFQNGEAILFYLNGLTLAARAKVFYDTPAQAFAEALRLKSARFGDGWKYYFESEARIEQQQQVNPGDCKRAYPWSVLGDWTLRLSYPPTQGQGRKLGIGWNFRHVFSGGEGIIYGVTDEGELRWYNHRTWKDGTIDFGEYPDGRVVGTGWNFRHVFSGGEGIIYGVTDEGELRWYKHADWMGGTNDWGDYPDGRPVGTDWNFRHVFSGGEGIIYGVTDEGELRWYKHADWMGGTNDWGNYPDGRAVGTDWNFRHVFSGGEGIIYGVTDEGELRWYKHADWMGGTNDWGDYPDGRPVGTDWNFRHVFSGGKGIIYGVTDEGDLRWYNHLRWQDGINSWQ